MIEPSVEPYDAEVTRRKLKELTSQLLPGYVTRQYWQEHLTVKQKRTLAKAGSQNLRSPEDPLKGWNALRMFQKLAGVSFSRAVIEVAHALDIITPREHARLLACIGASRDHADDLAKARIEAGDLVVCSSPPTVHFDKQQLGVKWTPGAFELFMQLARKAQAGKAIDWMDLYEIQDHGKRIKSRINRLKSLPGMPAAIKDKIVLAGTQTYRLDLKRERIHIRD